MKNSKLYLCAIAVSALALTSPAQADSWKDKAYIGGALGLTKTADADWSESTLPATGDFELGSAANIAVAAGVKVNPHLRTELEFSYRKADIDSASILGVNIPGSSGDLKTMALMANAYYDFTPDKQISPYVSGGLGFARHDGEYTVTGIGTDSDQDTVFAWQLGTGLSYDLNERVNLFGGYRWLASSDAEYGTLDVEYDAHEFRLGARYNF